MAKAQGKKTTTRSHGGGRHRGGDAARMAALRWLVMKIEQLGIEILVTSPGKFTVVENALRAQVQLLQQIGRPTLAAGDCPDGYILCRDGLCAPMCDDEMQSAVSAAKTRKRR
ncbi:MAG TPA: hypothetical protein PKW63_01855 [Vicinamibacterales bacterium]|nr:hypothetical protein [Vicinamibacterales bacterium]